MIQSTLIPIELTLIRATRKFVDAQFSDLFVWTLFLHDLSLNIEKNKIESWFFYNWQVFSFFLYLYNLLGGQIKFIQSLLLSQIQAPTGGGGRAKKQPVHP